MNPVNKTITNVFKDATIEYVSGLYAVSAAPGAALVSGWHDTPEAAEQEVIDWLWGDYKHGSS